MNTTENILLDNVFVNSIQLNKGVIIFITETKGNLILQKMPQLAYKVNYKVYGRLEELELPNNITLKEIIEDDNEEDVEKKDKSLINYKYIINDKVKIIFSCPYNTRDTEQAYIKKTNKRIQL